MEMILPSKCLNRDTLLAVYCNNSDTDKFLVGYPVADNKDYIILSRIDETANYDGLSLCSAAKIFRIECGSHYLGELQQKNPPMPTWNFTGDPVEYYLATLENSRKIAEIKDEEGLRLAFGLILEHTQSTIRIQSITLEGENAEVYDVERALVARINCDSELENEIQRLYERRHHFVAKRTDWQGNPMPY